jgi:Interferon-induced transmembrane protein
MTELQNRPNNYLVLSILSTIFCCWPLGIPAIVYASKVNTKFEEGDYEGAQEASKKAKTWIIWSVLAAFVILILYIVFIGAAIFTSYSN